MTQKLKVLVVDDSPTARQLLTSMVNSAPDMHVVGAAKDGEEAVKMAGELRPDVVAMDVVMPKMNGLEATSEIMHATPTPIVLVSASLKSHETDIAFEAVNRGALTVHRKPVGPHDPRYGAQVEVFLNTLRVMAEVRVIHHWRRGREAARPVSEAVRALVVPAAALTAPPEIVVMVSSTGGPAALLEILRGLPVDFPLPVVIAQHIAADFVQPLATWLAQATKRRIAIAEQGQQPRPGRVYFAPDSVHLAFTLGGRRFIYDTVTQARFVPSGDLLLKSAAQVYGARAVGVVLTGMGDDGAQGLRALYDAGAYTIAQDEKTAVVFSMPREAVNAGGARQMLPLSDIAPALAQLARSNAKGPALYNANPGG